MFRFFIGCLSLVAIGLFVSKAIAGGNNHHVNNNEGVMVIETVSDTTSSAIMPQDNSEMQPLPGDPGVEVAPLDNSSVVEPIVVEEDVVVEETGDGQ